MTAALLIGAFAYADEAKDFAITGSVELGIRSVQDGDKSAKFQEYRDLKSGVFGNMRFGGDNGAYYMDMTGENVGRDDQFFEVKGGRFGSFDYSAHYNEIIHNLTFGAKTFYANPGQNNLDYGATNRTRDVDAAYTPNVPTDAALWNTFDYSVKRKDTGASIDFTFGTPFYISVDANQLEQKGIRPFGTQSGLLRDFVNNPGGNSGFLQMELPSPVDYRTNTLNLKSGYNTKKYSFSFAGSLSKFENRNPFVTFRNPAVTTEDRTEIFSQAADNDYYKLSMQGSVRQLPLNSALALKVGYSKLENSFDLIKTVSTNTADATAVTSPRYGTVTLVTNTDRFKGNIEYQTASATLTSEPIKALDTKIYFDSVRKTDDSSSITYTNGADSASNRLLNYRKHDLGADVGYKVTMRTKATLGYAFEQVDRDRVDFSDTTDNSVYGEIKNSSLSWLTAKARYQRLWRNSTFTQFNDNTYLFFSRRFDAANKIQDSVKLSLDIDPTDRLNIGLEYTYKNNDYRDTQLGRQSDTRNEYYVDATYDIPGVVKFTAFFDYETVRAHDRYRTNSADPNTPPTSTNYNYSAELKDSNYYYGVGLQAPVIKNKLDFAASWTYEQANGTVNFGIPSLGQTFTATNTFVDMPYYDDYQRQTVNLKAIYKALKNFDLTLGYAYEHNVYNDLSMNSYRYYVTNTSFLTGAYSDQSYNVNLFYAQAGYKF